MPSREQVLVAIGPDNDYKRASDRLGIPPGQAYMVATGLPADGGDTFPPAELDRPGVIEDTTQPLVYDRHPVVNPTKRPEIMEWVKERAGQDAQMAGAARERDAAPGAPNEEDMEIGHALTRQHDQVTAMAEQLKAIPGVSKGGSAVHQSRRESIADMITMVLSVHETAEQEHFWPAVRQALDDGDSIADEALQQEQEGKDLLVALGKTAPSDEQFDELAQKLDKALRKHVAYEDRVLLRLAESMPEEQREELGRRLTRAEGHAPTRPHPHAPKRPGGAVKAAAPGAAALDRLRDNAGNRPAKRAGRADKQAKKQAQKQAEQQSENQAEQQEEG